MPTTLPALYKDRLSYKIGGSYRGGTSRHPLPPLLFILNLCSVLLLWAAPYTAQAEGSLKLTTWNLDWLTLRPAYDPALPPDIPARTAADFDILHHYAEALQSDLIALEEVDGLEAAERLFPPAEYDLIMSRAPIVQRVGLAIRRGKGLTVTVNPEITALNVPQSGFHHPLRSGLDVTVQYHNNAFRLLIVHLKTGCWAQPLAARKRACTLLYQQFHIIENWILDRQDDGIPFAILGDFNRRLTPADPLMLAFNEDAPLTLTTSGRSSPCQGGEQFIDHILLGNQARAWLIPDSLRVLTFQQTPEGADPPSDHCPVSVKLNIP